MPGSIKRAGNFVYKKLSRSEKRKEEERKQAELLEINMRGEFLNDFMSKLSVNLEDNIYNCMSLYDLFDIQARYNSKDDTKCYIALTFKLRKNVPSEYDNVAFDLPKGCEYYGLKIYKIDFFSDTNILNFKWNK